MTAQCNHSVSWYVDALLSHEKTVLKPEECVLASPRKVPTKKALSFRELWFPMGMKGLIWNRKFQRMLLLAPGVPFRLIQNEKIDFSLNCIFCITLSCPGLPENLGQKLHLLVFGKFLGEDNTYWQAEYIVGKS